MALLPTLSLITVAQDASSITIADVTGDYASNNTGGFGTPNPTKAALSGIILGLYSVADATVQAVYRLLDIAPIFLPAGEAYPAIRFSGITTGTTYLDGVYGIKYNLLYTGTGNITFTTGNKQFSLTNADTLFAAAVGFVLPDDTSKIYYIDRTKTLNSTGGWVTEILPTGAIVAYELVYEGDLKLLVDKAGDRCLTEDIAIWANEGCMDDTFRNIWPRYKQRIALLSKFSQGYLNDAHKLATGLAAYCSTSSTSCNC